MSDVDIGREAVERRAKAIELSWHDDARLFRALRAALDAAEAERDRLRDALQRVIADFDQRMLLDHSASNVAEREVIAHARAALAQKEPPRD